MMGCLIAQQSAIKFNELAIRNMQLVVESLQDMYLLAIQSLDLADLIVPLESLNIVQGDNASKMNYYRHQFMGRQHLGLFDVFSFLDVCNVNMEKVQD